LQSNQKAHYYPDEDDTLKQGVNRLDNKEKLFSGSSPSLIEFSRLPWPQALSIINFVQQLAVGADILELIIKSRAVAGDRRLPEVLPHEEVFGCSKLNSLRLPQHGIINVKLLLVSFVN
jgi:hypothetical protein